MARRLGTTKRAVDIKNFSKSEVLRAARHRRTTPLDFLLGIMNNEKRDLPLRVEAAKAALPYVHARIAQKIELDDQTPIERRQTDVVTLARMVAFFLAKSRAEKEAQDQAPIQIEGTAA